MKNARIHLLHHFFERTADRFGDQVAVEIPADHESDRVQATISYSELEEQSNKVANALQNQVGADDVVAIALSRCTLQMYIAQLAVLKAGGAYVGVELGFPDERIAQIIGDSESVLTLASKDTINRFDRAGMGTSRCIDIDEILATSVAKERPDTRANPDTSLAYLIYTSGTSGSPKGVMIEHRSVVNLIAGDVDCFGLTPGDRVTQTASPAWDSSVEEIWMAWSSGATLVVMDDFVIRSGPDIIPWLRLERITVLIGVPSQLKSTGCRDPEESLPDLRYLYVGGEAFPQYLADRWAPCCRIFNGYGPTETTVVSVRSELFAKQEITIGRAVPGATVHVLNEEFAPVTGDESGQLYVGGRCLARGYHNRPQLTVSKFIQHQEFGRLYQTGDRVRYNADGELVFLGRLDSQVKLRGYRIELEEVESHLAACKHVSGAACLVVGDSNRQELVALVVPAGEMQPSRDQLRAELKSVIPSYMIPAQFHIVGRLPLSVSGKLDRNRLEELLPTKETLVASEAENVLPRNELEAAIADAFGDELNLVQELSVVSDFFTDLGGDSLAAAGLVSRLRGEPRFRDVTVRDIYEKRTVEALALQFQEASQSPREVATDCSYLFPSAANDQLLHPTVVTIVQALFLIFLAWIVSVTLYLVAFKLSPVLLGIIGWLGMFALTPFLALFGLMAHTVVSVGATWGIKRLLIGKYRSLKVPVWSSLYLRHWIVSTVAKTIPWGMFTGTSLTAVTLKILGAKVGRRVHFHRGVKFYDCAWDLLEVGSDVTVCQDATLRTVELEMGKLFVGPVTIKSGATVDIRSALAPFSEIATNAYLGPFSSLETGFRVGPNERWDGMPAKYTEVAPSPDELTIAERNFSPIVHGTALKLAELAAGLVTGFPFYLASFMVVWLCGFFRSSPFSAEAAFPFSRIAASIGILSLIQPTRLLMQALLVRWMGPVPQGCLSRWGTNYIRVWIKTGIVESAGRILSGSLMWMSWLRLSGMKIGRNSEISRVIDILPELVEVGKDSFFAEGVYLACPRMHRGRVTLEKARLDNDTFLGNHVLIPGGQSLPPGILIGVSTIADDQKIKSNESWFGIPPFLLPKREVVEMSRALTHSPGLYRWLRRAFWEQLRFLLPLLIAALAYGFFEVVSQLQGHNSSLFFAVLLPACFLLMLLLSCLITILTKWLLLGRVKPGSHGLWSSWCARWDFLFLVWAALAKDVFIWLEGSTLLNLFLRLFGMKIGKRVLLGPEFAHVVDPDMLTIEDDAMVSCFLQVHTFEDRVLKIDRMRIRRRGTISRGTVILYGADIGESSHVRHNSVILKNEVLSPSTIYQGCPAARLGTEKTKAITTD